LVRASASCGSTRTNGKSTTTELVAHLLRSAGLAAEALSVMAQVAWFRWRKGERLFRMAPLHHHFELLGWSETQVVVRFWIVGILLLLLSMSTIKLQ
jgi:UDP-N-acetylmuramyl pentapeptide phosphotransferase/UDP-N-acetylglucosamine-1-phosphate transferase